MKRSRELDAKLTSEGPAGYSYCSIIQELDPLRECARTTQDWHRRTVDGKSTAIGSDSAAHEGPLVHLVVLFSTRTDSCIAVPSHRSTEFQSLKDEIERLKREREVDLRD